ncbi:MAG: methylenetetrahydrofolate--tRNA-(uracil(54)-C(5))-methyltransferase (FADH(2)-oxidizing) TrmFO [Clostridia bacterium]|nr:methylenetetrahydrofolate--tRNA-(uracil(54)-C(5))-methyltransferase (FADH(2)-oxidizing) TrmFO [Clostridia bacterium]
MTGPVNVIGAGLAGCEAAWQLARRGVNVRLFEMKPEKMSPAHSSPLFAELVCSNSLRASALTNAVGLLKEEMRLLSSLIMEAADSCRVPAGAALAVDRTLFSGYITDKIRSHPLIETVYGEVTAIDTDAVNIIATGPLTSEAMSRCIADMISNDTLYFYDAAAPIVSAESVDKDIAFFASRYGKGEASYLNCPMTKEQYDVFYNALVNAEEAPVHEFDKRSPKVFEACMPVEVMAKRGYDTLRYGPLKPVGLPDPVTGKDYYAVVQLRAENKKMTMFNLVGFQTHLTFPEQKRVFSLIPSLENAEFLRYGVMHRNTYINSPKLLSFDYSMKTDPDLFFAGQMTGVEGYVESAASGLTAGINAARRILGKDPVDFPDVTAIGALAHYISSATVTDFQPMNVNFGIMSPLGEKVRGGKAARNTALSERALGVIRNLSSEI